jgi:sugar-specific transcriptional regulator TrmB
MEERFRKLGMNDNEREVYLSVIGAGKISTHQVAKGTGINRTTAYSIAKKFEKTGVLARNRRELFKGLWALAPGSSGT